MDFENVDLKKLAEEKAYTEEVTESTETQSSQKEVLESTDAVKEKESKTKPVEISESDKEILTGVATNEALMAAYAEDPSIATVTSTVDFENVKVGPPATPENLERIKQGLPPLLPNGQPWYPEGQEPKGEKNEEKKEPTKPSLPEKPKPTGLVIETPKEEKPLSDIPPQMLEDAERYLENMDKDYEEATEIRKKVAEFNPTVASAEEVAQIHGEAAAKEIQEHVARVTNHQDDIKPIEELVEAEEDPREATKERLEKFSEVIISIDKVNSSNLEFTAEERAKMEVVDKIKLEEVEVVDLATVRRRKAKTGAVDTLIKRMGNTARSFNMIIPASGYVATMSGCSLHELMNLIREGSDPVQDYVMKWSIIHSKLITTSLGDMPDFDYFMKHTADADMNAFIYAIMVASLPATDSITLRCNEDKCKLPNGDGREYQFEYSVRSLLRVEEFDDELIEALNNISAASTTKESAMEVHMKSHVMTSTAIRLPDSRNIVEIQLPSAYDFLERSLKVVTKNDEVKPEYSSAAVSASQVNAILIQDEEGVIEATEPLDIIKLIYKLPPRDVLILERMIDKVSANKSFAFGLVDINCPYCNHHTEVLPIDISELLFIRNAKVMETIVE